MTGLSRRKFLTSTATLAVAVGVVGVEINRPPQALGSADQNSVLQLGQAIAFATIGSSYSATPASRHFTTSPERLRSNLDTLSHRDVVAVESGVKWWRRNFDLKDAQLFSQYLSPAKFSQLNGRLRQDIELSAGLAIVSTGTRFASGIQYVGSLWLAGAMREGRGSGSPRAA